MEKDKVWNKKLNCPQCGNELEVESVRKHRGGKVRVYWECDNCKLSIMHRGD